MRFAFIVGCACWTGWPDTNSCIRLTRYPYPWCAVYGGRGGGGTNCGFLTIEQCRAT
jgi:hypothetical protein